MNNLDIFYIIIFIFVIYFVFFHISEGIENTAPQTIFGVNNAYTGLHCYDNNLPIVSVNNTITCISKDGINCLMRNDLKIPSVDILDGSGNIITHNISCRNDQDKNFNVNTFLSKDGIRQLANGSVNPNTRDIFNDLSSNGYYTLQCNQSGLNDPNHWCNQTYSNIQDMCSKYDQFSKSSHTECGDSLTTFKNSASTNTTSGPVLSTLYKTSEVTATGAPPNASKIMSCKNKDCIRGRPSGMTLSTCQANCSVCGKSTCN